MTDPKLTEAMPELDVPKLKALIAKATRGPWRLDTGVFDKDLRVTAYEREGFNKDGDGPICHVSTERMHFSEDDGLRRESRSWTTPISKARADAELIVAAVNALPELLRRLGHGDCETAWLIEWPADKFGPIRYWTASETQPVIDHLEATRFSRKADADAVVKAMGLKGCKSVEHMWLENLPEQSK